MAFRVVRGKGTPEEIAHVKAALDDPSSLLSTSLHEFQEWAIAAFPTNKGNEMAAQSPEWAALGAAKSLVLKLEEQGNITVNERMVALATSSPGESFSPQDCKKAMRRMFEYLILARPELTEELKEWEASNSKGGGALGR
jgi:hypothetical protein